MLRKMYSFFLAIILATAILIPQMPAYATPASSTDGDGGGRGESTSKTSSDTVYEGRKGSECPVFLGLTSWDCGVEIKDEETLKSGIWQIVANIATDITVIAAYLVLGYVIYGGYQYIFSSGDPNKVASGKKTLTQAFIGLAIVMSAYLIVNTIRYALVRNKQLATNCATSQCINPGIMFANAIGWVIGIAGIVAAIFVVYGGILYATSSGDANKLQKAKQTIIYALIGLIIVAISQLITAYISNIIRDANSTSYNNTLILKEPHEKQII